MCDGGVISVPLTMAILGAATAVYTAKEQKKAIEQQAQVQQDQIDSKAQQAKNQRMEEARAARATARAAAAEAAVSGNSLALIEVDVMGQAGKDISTIEVNRKNGIEASAAEAGAAQRMASADMWSGVGSSVAGGVSGAYNNYTIKKNGGV